MDHEVAGARVQHRGDAFVLAVVRALVDSFRVAGAKGDPVQEADRRLGQRVLVVVGTHEEDGFAAVIPDDLHGVRAGRPTTTSEAAATAAAARLAVVHQKRTGVGVELVGIPLADRVASLRVVQPDSVLGDRAAPAASAEATAAAPATAGSLGDEKPAVVRRVAVVRHAPVALVENGRVVLSERSRPQHDTILPARVGLVVLFLCRGLVALLFLGSGLHSQERQAGPVFAPHDLTPVRFLFVARDARSRWGLRGCRC